jgi:hypothetical protein
MGSKDIKDKAAASTAPRAAGAKVSTKLMGLKFMQRAQAKSDMIKRKVENKKALKEVRNL